MTTYSAENLNENLIEELLWTMGRPEEPLTEESQFIDFYRNDEEWEDLQDTIRKVYGADIEIEDYIYEVADKINNKEK